MLLSGIQADDWRTLLIGILDSRHALSALRAGARMAQARGNDVVDSVKIRVIRG
jgi:hypothetical protein